jgi:hypothetical protein
MPDGKHALHLLSLPTVHLFLACSAMPPVPLSLPSFPIPLQLCMGCRMISRREPPIARRERDQDTRYPLGGGRYTHGPL